MVGTPKGRSLNIIITNDLGLHARPAAAISKIAVQSRSDVTITKDGESVDATSVIDILTLCCVKGSCITVEVEDPQDEWVLSEIEKLFLNRV